MPRQRMEPATFKAFRARFGLTQADAASLLGVERRTVLNWENNDKPLSGPPVAFVRIFMMLTEPQRQALIAEARNEPS
ncbi:MAG: helix-turn-helix domain-containing protein [Magnetovibrionaceae bacterium]